MTYCPDCGAVLEVVKGQIGQMVYKYMGHGRWQKRDATFYACTGCEFCEEIER